MSRRPNPKLYYLGVLILNWPFVLYWTYRLKKSILRLTNETLDIVRVLFWFAVFTSMITAAWILGVKATSMLWAWGDWLPTAGINSAFASVALVISILVILNRRLLQVEHKHHTLYDDLKIIFFSLVFFISLPMLQRRINDVVGRMSHSRHGTTRGRQAVGQEHVRHA